ncbi:hypothetical protein DFH07DRAFT_943449 [Mycena maculata]|uniref:Uncharacterized protein n=1 Tax=Mycena maculata TaxID=230809 RepID=A0AAD7IFP1_9AGAR|nr:hypothetical protein DFH07DRAFT_943449 [Mycena maculata]
MKGFGRVLIESFMMYRPGDAKMAIIGGDSDAKCGKLGDHQISAGRDNWDLKEESFMMYRPEDVKMAVIGGDSDAERRELGDCQTSAGQDDWDPKEERSRRFRVGDAKFDVIDGDGDTEPGEPGNRQMSMGLDDCNPRDGVCALYEGKQPSIERGPGGFDLGMQKIAMVLNDSDDELVSRGKRQTNAGRDNWDPRDGVHALDEGIRPSLDRDPGVSSWGREI